MSDTTTAPSTNQGTILVYCLNAPEERDLEFRDAIRQHLKPIIRKLRESGVLLELLDDDSMLASAEIEVHRRRLSDAHIVLALLSSAFIDDDDIYDRSLPVLARAEAGQLVMISILVRNFNWKDTPFADGLVLPDNQTPLNNWPDKDDAVTAVVKEVGDEIKRIVNRERVARPPLTPAVAGETARLADEPAEAASDVEIENGSGPDPQAEAAIEPSRNFVPPTSAWEPPTVQQSLAAAPTAGTFEPPVVAPAGVARAESTPPTREKPIAVVDWRKRYYRRVLWKRGLALLLDYGVFFFAPAFVFGILAYVLGNENVSSNVATVIFLVSLIALITIAPAFESSRWRATPGKRILKMQITTKDGDQISYWRAFQRNIMRIVVAFAYFLLIPLVVQVARFPKTKKLFHDEITHTEIGERVPH